MKKGLIFLAFIGIMTSCSKDDDNLLYSDLDGRWNLIAVDCGFCEPLNFNIGDHLWTFDTSIENLLVENNVSIQHQSLLESGSYDFNETDNTVTVLSIEYDYYFNKGKLILSDHPEVDGTVLEFVKENL